MVHHSTLGKVSKMGFQGRWTAKGGFGHDAGMYAAVKAQHVLQVVPWRIAVQAFSADGL